MAKKKKKMPGLNTSSTADISFMLLVFFLVTSSMDTDKGLVRRLPPPPEDEQKTEMQIHERNVMLVDIASSGKVRICKEKFIETNFSTDNNIKASYEKLAELRELAKKFIAGEPHVGSTEAPEFSLDNVDNGQQIGVVPCFDKHVISLQSDRGTPYAAYFAVQNELVAAYNELRDERSMKEYGVPYSKLDDERKEVIRKIYPQKISEAEPKDYSKLNQ